MDIETRGIILSKQQITKDGLDGGSSKSVVNKILDN